MAECVVLKWNEMGGLGEGDTCASSERGGRKFIK